MGGIYGTNNFSVVVPAAAGNIDYARHSFSGDNAEY